MSNRTAIIMIIGAFANEFNSFATSILVQVHFYEKEWKMERVGSYTVDAARILTSSPINKVPNAQLVENTNIFKILLQS